MQSLRMTPWVARCGGGRGRTLGTRTFFSSLKVDKPVRKNVNSWALPKRTISQSSIHPAQEAAANVVNQPWARWLGSAALIGGTMWGANAFLNRDKRNELAPRERALLNSTFNYMGAGLGIVAATAYGLHTAGWTRVLMRTNQWAVLGGGLVASIGTMVLTLNTSPEKTGVKHLAWLGFQVSQAAILAPLVLFNPAILMRAGLYTAGVVGALSYIGATAREDRYLYLGGPLLAGVAVVALSSLAPLILPATAVRSLVLTQSVSLYGGLGVFSLFVLYDVQKVLAHARSGAPLDPINESLGLELDFINIFVRIVQILGMQQQRR